MIEYKKFNALEITLKGAIKLAIFRMDSSGETGSFSQFKKDYNAASLVDGKPVIRFYPNDVKG